MGIKQLTKLIGDNAPAAIKVGSLGLYIYFDRFAQLSLFATA